MGELCERGRFRSPTRETFLRWEIGPKRGSLPPNEVGLATGAYTSYRVLIY